MARSFYAVLGVSRDADLGQIRSAYRKLVRQYHPDLAAPPTPETPEQLLEVQRAYETLKHPSTRNVHDAQINPLADEASAGCPEAEPLEPGRGGPARRAQRRWPQTPGRPMASSLWSEVDEMLGGWLPGFFASGRQRSRHKDLFAELILSHDEAARGGLFTLELPVLTACSQCRGSGLYGMLYCPRCEGRTHERHRVDLSVPPGVCDGQRARVSLEDIGGPRVNLDILVAVRGR